MRTMSYREFKRRVFNEALQECLTKFTLKCCGGEGSMDTTMDSSKYTEIAANMSKDFYNNLLNLNEKTITETKKCMCEAVTFIQDCIAVSEAIAEEKANDAQEEHLEIPEDQDIELSKEDQEVIDTLYDDKEPAVQIDAVRDATVRALMAEDRKAQEVKDAINIANAQVKVDEREHSKEEAEASLKETAYRMNRPHSLMHAIMNGFSRTALKAVSESAGVDGMKNPGKILKENAQEIKNRSIIMYSLFESASVLGLKQFTPTEVKKIAEEIYYQ